jgi:hypothetical protein
LPARKSGIEIACIHRRNINRNSYSACEVGGIVHLVVAFRDSRGRVAILYFPYSRISPGWHSRALQIAARVDRRIAFALAFFNTEILAIVMPTLSASSVTLIFRFANITSMLMMIAILVSLHR